eukprot:TRINITY_DN43082_c0_g1_i3.p1 TRINITY_DN43082_c0_g1~~TRINITY_DN43082_c0_g1_i3.p1  ORF type:complete len:226 (+),score=26.17 TRINITY_DN43082_c0_g1_i3:97-678(+)
MWIFGFGSLVYNPGFEYSEKVCGFIKDYKRVFYQGSTDHRGTPEAPGRTVTLEPSPGNVTWGVAFKLAGDKEQQEKSLKYLEWREKQYDLRTYVDVYTDQNSNVAVIKGALTYIATNDKQKNQNYLGYASEEEIAQQIATSHGPSGPNHEYLFKLAHAMREIGVIDNELFSLEDRVKELMSQNAATLVVAGNL